MAMHTSEGLLEIIHVLREQMAGLGEKELESVLIHVYEEKSEEFEAWYSYRHASDPNGKIIHGKVLLNWTKTARAYKDKEKYYSAETDYTIVADYKMLKEWYEYLEEVVPEVVEHDETGKILIPDALYYNYSKIFGGTMLLITNKEASDDSKHLLKRSAEVFNLAYTRFLDLQKAEAQAKEAKIEAALERVRAQTMAMNKSQDLQQVVSVIFRELDKLELKTLRCGIGIMNADNRSVDVWTTTTTNEGYEVNFSGNESMDVHPMLQGVFAAWEKQEDFYYTLQGEDLISYYDTMSGDNYKLPDAAAGASVSGSDCQYYYCTFFLSGGIYFFRQIPFTEEVIKVIRRFANAFSLAYKRFEDLKQAEARALEAIKESSLDRVRAEIASMRTTDDLQRITPIIWRELMMLEVPFFRCGVFIIDEINTEVKIYLSAPDGHSLGVMNVPFHANSVTANSVDHWRKGLVYTEHWDKEAFVNWMQTMIEQGQIQSSEAYQDTAKPPESLDMHFVPFSQGMLYVGNSNPLAKEKIDLVKSLAETFSIAYARYEDFNKLESAKEQIEKTLVDLKQAQAQLVQSEKMASLGELTAGIAHEIQNPLNFVNNFSEVSTELLDEMIAELGNDNKADAIAIAGDVKQNLQKILHHGKQADGIVKGMLQHSRSSSAVKEPTDINKLADEYLRLAFHGLRAKDKSFNAILKTDYDETIGNINIIPQDIGRVILNLITNAFYAVAEKKKNPHPLKGGMEYEPIVTVSTKRLGSLSGDGGKIEISVADNGNGIPQKILDKIFQPFFTTKPTGQGTGLGLSLSYDIVKAHNGEIRVNTKESEYAEFIVQLPASA
ncbi:MAG: ATP-binding protein [Bacteroidota bacterium]|nr:ATP-binding protein [Bacteroidota bacterium]